MRHGAGDAADLGEALRLGRPLLLGEGVGEVGEEHRRGAVLEHRGAVAQRLLATAAVHGDLAASGAEPGPSCLAQDVGQRGDGRVSLCELVEVSPEDLRDVHAQHARGGGVEHAYAAIAVGGDGGGLHVLQDCAGKLLYGPVLHSLASPLDMQYVPRIRVTNAVGRRCAFGAGDAGLRQAADSGACGELLDLGVVEELGRERGVEDAGAIALRVGGAGGQSVPQALRELELAEARADEAGEERVAGADRADDGLERR